jgi:hypothetical protein
MLCRGVLLYAPAGLTPYIPLSSLAGEGLGVGYQFEQPAGCFFAAG